jgi:hypothetical protein
MLSLLKRFTTSEKRAPKVSRSHIALEALEPRWCMAAPTIDSIYFSLGGSGYVSIYGWVSDENRSTVKVNVSGVVNGQADVDPTGYFSFYGQTNTLGEITAQAIDEEQLLSDAVVHELTSDPPELGTLSAKAMMGSWWTVEGMVTDDTTNQLLLTFGGYLEGHSMMVTSGQKFTYYFNFDSKYGTSLITAFVTDEWGLKSEEQEVWLI